MAVLLSSQSLLVSSPRPSSSTSFSSNPVKTLLQPNLIAFPSRSYSSCKPLLGFNTKYSPVCNVHRRIVCNYYSSAEDSIRSTKDERDEAQNDVNIGVLIEAYKEAIFYGERRAVSQIEARLQAIANERNELIQKVSTLSTEKTAFKEKYLRLLSDFENFRKRSEKDRIRIQSDAQGEVFEKLLLMVDNFERAKQQIIPETEKEKVIDASYQGIYKQFVEIMNSHHIAAVATVGKPFDPLFHEAVAREESIEFKEGIVIQELRRGFLHGDRLLRPALVKVSSGPGNKKSKEQPATSAAAVNAR